MAGHGAARPGGVDWARAREGHDQGQAVHALRKKTHRWGKKRIQTGTCVTSGVVDNFTNYINLMFSYHPLKCFRGSRANRAIGVWLGKVRLELFFADLELLKLSQTVPHS
jgi:hypothetical protein